MAVRTRIEQFEPPRGTLWWIQSQAEVETADWTDQTLPSWRHSVWVRDSGFTPFTLVKTLVATVNCKSTIGELEFGRLQRVPACFKLSKKCQKQLEGVNLTVKRCQKLGTLLTSLVA